MKFIHPNGMRITRGELSGAFGDIGTDLPLITGMILATGMNPASVLIVFGLTQISSALIYGIPLLVQPFKAVAADEIEEALALGLLDCVECGLCSFVCPAKIEISDLLKTAKEAYSKEIA